MKFTLRKVLIVLLALVFVGSGAMVIADQIQKWTAEKAYQEAAELANVPERPETESAVKTEVSEGASAPEQTEGTTEEPDGPEEKSEPVVYVDPYADALRNMDFAALREANPDVLGWIMIPDTRVSYPLVQGDDNDYYLKRTWRGSYSNVGAIFVEHHCSADLSDFNTIIYGHRMNNGSMFGSLENYRDAAYLAAHPYIYITDDTGCHTYQIFSVMETAVDSPVYAWEITEMTEKQAVLNWSVRNSEVDTGVMPVFRDRIVTLSTCTGRGYETRFVVQAVLLQDEADEAPAEDAAAEGESGEAVEMPTDSATEGVPEADGEMTDEPAEVSDEAQESPDQTSES